MRQIVGSNYGGYTLDVDNNRIIVSGIDDILGVEQILMIQNVSFGQTLYTGLTLAGDSAITVSDNIITFPVGFLAGNGVGNTDKLQIIVDAPSRDTEILKTLYKIQRLLEPSANVDPATGSQKVAATIAGTMPVSGTLTGVTTVATVTNITSLNQVAAMDARFLLQDLSRQAFNSGIRPRYTFT